jgi:hypothetical protein
MFMPTYVISCARLPVILGDVPARAIDKEFSFAFVPTTLRPEADGAGAYRGSRSRTSSGDLAAR